MFLAARRLKVLKHVVKAYMDIAYRNRRGGALQWSAWLGSTDAVEALAGGYTGMSETDKYYEPPLHWASYLALHELVKAIVDTESEAVERVNHAGETPLFLAAQNGGEDVVHVLLESQANIAVVDNYGRTVLHHSASNGRLDLVELFLEAHEELLSKRDKDGFTALHCAVQRGQLNIVRFLLECHFKAGHKIEDIARPTAKDSQTLFHHGAACGQVSVLKLLLSMGNVVSLLDKQDCDGVTALHLLSQIGESEGVNILLKAGANPKVKKYLGLGASPLHIAARNGHLEVVTLLLRAGADPCDRDFKDRWNTPLHSAILGNQQEIAKMLVSANPRVMKQPDHSGITPFDLVKARKYQNLVDFMKNYGKSENSGKSNKSWFKLSGKKA